MSEWLFVQQAYVPADIALPKGLPHLCSRSRGRTDIPNGNNILSVASIPISPPGHSWDPVVTGSQQHYAAASVSLTLAGRPRLTVPPFTAARAARAAKRA